MSTIKDLNLAPSGERKIRWVEAHMPVLRDIGSDFAREKPFAGLKIALSVHLEAKTAYLCRVLEMGGAEMHVTGSNPLSTQDDVAAALAAKGMDVHAVAHITGGGLIENPPRAIADRMVKGGITAYNSSKKPLNGVGEGWVGTPSTSPRTGSRSVATHAASSRPGMPTAMTAACQPTRPSGPPSGKAAFQRSTVRPPMNSESPPPM